MKKTAAVPLLITALLILLPTGCKFMRDKVSSIDGIWQYSYLIEGQPIGEGFIAFARGQVVLRTWSGCPSTGHLLETGNSNIAIDLSSRISGHYYAGCDTSSSVSGSEDYTDAAAVDLHKYSFDLLRESSAGTESLSGTTTGHYAQGDTVYGFEASRAIPYDLFQPFNEQPGMCMPDASTLCLQNGRFKVTADWRDGNSASGQAQAVPSAGQADTGFFYFTEPDNLELLVKVLDGCQMNDRHWIFASGMTSNEFTLTVTDTETGFGKRYMNPLGEPAPAITDTSAFATCP